MTEQCPECGKKFKVLASHMRLKHQQTLEGDPLLPEVEPRQDISPKPNPFEIPPELIASIVAPVVEQIATKVVGKAVNDLAAQLPDVVDKMLTARLDQEAARALDRMTEMQQGQSQQPQQPQGRGSAMDMIMGQWAQKMMGQMMGGEVQSGGFENFLKQMVMFRQAMAQAEAPSPQFVLGLKTMADMQTASIRMGATPEAAAAAGSKIVESMMPKPEQASDQSK